jgi:thiamine biosynthesis lipoprotein
MKRKDIVYFIVLLAIMAIAAWMHYGRLQPVNRSSFAMDTFVDVSFNAPRGEGEAWADSVFALISHYEQALSCFKAESEIWHLNHANINKMCITKDVSDILTFAAPLYKQTDGAYDITVGRVSELWDFSQSAIPQPDSLAAALQHVGMNQLNWNDNTLTKPIGMHLNFGSLAKGYIIDKAVDYLQSVGAKNILVNAGGDIRLLNNTAATRIGIQHPRDQRAQLIGVLNIPDGAVVTSGDYERYFVLDGQRYHHILDARTGMPSRQAISITVLAPTAVQADALSTALFLMHPAAAIDYVESLANVETIIFFEERGKVTSLASSGMNRILEKQ